MNKKKLIIMLSTIGAIAAIGVGATLAYFTANDSATNVVTMGNVSITLTENEVTKGSDGHTYEQTNAITEDGLEFSEIMPGDTIPKNPTITLADTSNDAYVRINMDIQFSGTITADVREKLQTSLLASLNNEILAEGSRWYYNSTDGYYYYNVPLTQNNKTAVLFTTVNLPSDWGNEAANAQFNIVLNAQAVQSDNFNPTTNDNGMVTDWGNVTIE